MQYSREGRELLRRAAESARKLGHSYVGSVHLLIAFSRQPNLTGHLLNCFGVSEEMTGHMAMILYGTGTPGLPLNQGFTKHSTAILRGAAIEARHNGSAVVEPVHIFLSMLRRESAASGELMRI